MIRNQFVSSKVLLSICILFSISEAKEINPFAVNNGFIPSKQEYSGPLFKFNYNYPTKLIEPKKKPWSDVSKGKELTTDNAHAYVIALKKYVENPMKVFVNTPKKWNNNAQSGWYSMLWAGENVKKTGWEGRDSIYGTYTGQIMSKDVYAKYGLTVDIRNHAGIYYNETAAHALHKVWKDCDKKLMECIPRVDNNEAQFPEGSIIIKSAGVTSTPEEWPVLEGAAKWQIFRKAFDLNGTIEDSKRRVTDIRVGIFDIIIKDSVASPETGWVFSTLVYDKDAKGKTPWDRMVPLGAMWGNNPDVNSAKNPKQKLTQNYINPSAPAWTKETLGYGGRMSGPFDIAVKYNVDVDGKVLKQLRSSSCLSCHGTVSYIKDNFEMTTFFYPAKDFKTSPWVMYTPGSKGWNEWFQNRAGTQTQTKNQKAIALDYSTFLEAVLMNYAASKSEISKDSFKKFRQYRKTKSHY